MLSLALSGGCRVAASDRRAPDAATPRGTGLPDRVVTDAALWADLAPAASSRDGGRVDRPPASMDGAADAASDPGVERPAVATCNLFDNDCPADEGCYTDEAFTGATACLPGAAGNLERFPCQVQSDCAPAEICLPVKGMGQLCLQLCRTDVPGGNCLDLVSSACVPLPRYPGVGYCL